MVPWETLNRDARRVEEELETSLASLARCARTALRAENHAGRASVPWPAAIATVRLFAPADSLMAMVSWAGTRNR